MPIWTQMPSTPWRVQGLDAEDNPCEPTAAARFEVLDYDNFVVCVIDDAQTADLVTASPQLYVALKGLLFAKQHGNGCEAWHANIERAKAALLAAGASRGW